jgi:hypothetical protein
MELISVSGTELVVKIPDDLATECGGSSGSFKVVLLESGLETTGGNFRIVGNTPTVLSVSPIILEQIIGPPQDVSPDDITITGSSFASEVLVQVGTYTMPSGQVTVNGQTSIDVDNLPGVDVLGVVFATTPCVTPAGDPGAQSAATPLSVSVTNFPGACTDTLAGAIVIEPEASACSPLSMAVAPGAIAFGNVAGSQDISITNDGAGEFQWSASLSDADGVFSISPTSGTLFPGEATLVTVTFSLAENPAGHSGSVQISSNPVGILGSPATVTLSATTP